MIREGQPYVLEYNVRMGDPECQPITMRMDSDLYDYLVASVDGNLSSIPPISWKNQSAVCVVLASEGYPESYVKMRKSQTLNLYLTELVFFMPEQEKKTTRSSQTAGVC